MNENLFSQTAMDAPGAGFTAHCDGGSRGNPGPAGFGAVVEDGQGRVVARLSEFLGVQTNNFAEYSGLLSVLRWAIENGVERLTVVSDSELMVKQMQGKYAVKSPVLRPLYDEARKLARQVAKFEMRHTLRAGNKEADQLANEAMDRGMGRGVEKTAGRPGGGSASQRVSGPVSTTGRGAEAAPAAKTVPVTTMPVKAAPAHAERQVLEGYVKGGVVHLLGGELPDGIFVKVIRE